MISTALAQVNIGAEYGSPWGVDFDLGVLVSNSVSLGITIAGIILIFIFIFGGIKVIGGAGNNDPKAAAQGKQALTYAIIGFIIVFTSYWTIRFIEIVLGNNFLTNP